MARPPSVRVVEAWAFRPANRYSLNDWLQPRSSSIGLIAYPLPQYPQFFHSHLREKSSISRFVRSLSAGPELLRCASTKVAAMLSKCANPLCSVPFQYLRDGKVFQVELDESGQLCLPALSVRKSART